MNSYQVLIKKLVVGNYPLAYFIIFRQSVLVATCVPFSNPELSSSDMAGARLASLGFEESSLKKMEMILQIRLTSQGFATVITME